ncbi:hypothetical protein N9C80_08580, partial [Paracoccaceae bacterium]|nr:hypothetical protein [Paracoccaceae bacterium]
MIQVNEKVHLFIVLLLIFLPFSGAESPTKFVFYTLWMILSVTSILFLSANFLKQEFASSFIIYLLLILIPLAILKENLFGHTDFVETLSVIMSIPVIYLLSKVYVSSALRTRLAVFILILSCVHGMAGLEQIFNGKDFIWHNLP